MADQQISLVDHTTGTNTPSTTITQSDQPPPTDPSSHIDILYENQRGWFVFGIPLFSHRALWNLRIDPAPWQDAKCRPSAVNITNAQVPDPSWVWDWKMWYVDMSLDVDEEGWQYNLLFKRSAWHGNHPWFHSFVRRRRWLRRRVKQRLPPKTRANTKERMFGETFSIGTTLATSATFGTSTGLLDSSQPSLDEEIRDIATLMKKLKMAAIDREKIVYMHDFIDHGGEELYYLAEHIPAIMSMLIFQNSRRQLLSTLMDRFDAAKDRHEQHERNAEPGGAAEERRINSLLKAIEAADNECKKLEYWSDIKNLAEEGKAGNATDPSMGWDEKWQGIDGSGASHPET